MENNIMMVRSKIDRRKPRTRMVGTMLTSEEYQKLRVAE